MASSSVVRSTMPTSATSGDVINSTGLQSRHSPSHLSNDSDPTIAFCRSFIPFVLSGRSVDHTETGCITQLQPYDECSYLNRLL